MRVIFFILVLLLLFGGIPTSGYGFGNYGHGGLAAVLLILIILVLLGVL